MALKQGGLRTSLRNVTTKSLIPDSGVARYEFEKDVTDSWGSFDGTDNTSDGYSTGQVGSFAKDFDGVDDYVSIPTNFGIFDGSQDFSVAAWLNYPSISGDLFYVGFRGENGVRARLNPNNTITFQIIDSNINTYNPTSSSSFTNQWVHAVGVFNSGGDVILYIDGNSEDVVSANVTNINNSSNDSAIGVDKDGNEKYYSGSVDDLRIYDKALSSTEVSNLFNNASI
jgi:sialidase-1